MWYAVCSFTELEVADSLKLWNEGFRIVEDIYTLMQVSTDNGSRTRDLRL